MAVEGEALRIKHQVRIQSIGLAGENLFAVPGVPDMYEDIPMLDVGSQKTSVLKT